MNKMLPHFKCFECANGRTYQAPEKSCCFCKHCTDIFYDFTHGPYLFMCDENHDTETAFENKCDYFEEENE